MKPGLRLSSIMKRIEGQASIMVAMMMMTFILFFAFVVNTGMLVNAKINLQNAADMAAFAGAATQARQLNQISYLNYEMRRQYKKFLFRYYVIGNMAQKTHPGNANTVATGKRFWSPDGDPRNDYKVPAVCVIFNPRDNYCQVGNLQALSIPPGSPLDALSGTLRGQLESIEQIRQDNCKSIGRANVTLLGLWLYNTDPKLIQLEKQIVSDPKQQNSLQVIRGLSYGLGLLPRELLLHRRIETMKTFVNKQALSGISKGMVDTLARGSEAVENERTVQAFYSAFNTLGNNTFDDTDSIQMDEILPAGTDGASLLKLDPIKVGFDAYSVDFEFVNPNGVVDPNNKRKDCKPILVPFNVAASIPVGVVKDPAIKTYYAVRLQARAKVMFSPFGDMLLKAYSAAQPFGSRIGPAWTDENFLRKDVSAPVCQQGGLVGGTLNGKCMEQVPNLPVMANDPLSPGDRGWNTNDVISSMYSLFRTNNGALPQVLGPDDMERAYIGAMAPNPPESGKYNILNDLAPDPFVKNFDDDTKPMAAFWAPLFPASQQGSDSAIQNAINDMIDQAKPPPSTTGPGSTFSGALTTELKARIAEYLAQLRQGAGEDGEGFNIVRISDPYRVPQPNGPAKKVNLPPTILLDEVAKVKTSWNQVNDGTMRPLGRTGYSVKFVSFKSLKDGSVSTDGGKTTPTNVLPIDPTTEQDIFGSGVIQH